MKEKLLGIYAGALFMPPDFMHKWDERNLITGGIGGSEIWAIELASQFEKNTDYHCVVFADCETWHFADNGVEYIPYNLFKNYVAIQHFETIIVSRYPEVIDNSINADKIYLMIHDGYALNCDSYNDLHMEKVEKICIQSNFQKETLKKRYEGLTDNDFFKSFQGVHLSKYDSQIEQVEKKNCMLWSSHKVRGSKFLIERVLPLIRKEVPDFEINVCGYIKDTTDDYFNAEGVNVLGCLEKDELIKRQLESKIWIYPNWGKYENGWDFDETFCITAVENGMAGNALIVADKGCFTTTLEGYKHFVGTELFDDDSILLSEDKMDDFAQALASKAIEYLKNEDLRKEVADEAKEICDRYTWEHVLDTWLVENNNFKNPNKVSPLYKIEEERNINTVIVVDVIEADADNGLTEIRNHWKKMSEIFQSMPNINFIWDVCVSDGVNSDEAISAIKANINPIYGWLYRDINMNNAYYNIVSTLNYANNTFYEGNSEGVWVFYSSHPSDLELLPRIINNEKIDSNTYYFKSLAKSI